MFFFFFSCSLYHLVLHLLTPLSPTRRSSDLRCPPHPAQSGGRGLCLSDAHRAAGGDGGELSFLPWPWRSGAADLAWHSGEGRGGPDGVQAAHAAGDRKSTRLNSSH